MTWKVKGGRVGEGLPLVRLHPRVRAWIESRRKNETWAVAFSGGADSLALLLVLRAHFPGRALVALHFNHRLRGRAATADAVFCQRVCRALGIKCVVGLWKDAPDEPNENACRIARHAFFTRAMKSERSKILLLAHQQDDIAESMLMRLARGSGTGGLAAPRPVQLLRGGRVHLRPLLTIKKAELVATLKTAGASWREDASNVSDNHFRNRVRHHVLPAWVAASGRDALAGAALAREALEEDDAALDAWVDEIAQFDDADRLDLARLRNKPRAVLRRTLHRWLAVACPETDLSRQGFEQMLAAVERGTNTRFSLGAKGFGVVRRGWLSFETV